MDLIGIKVRDIHHYNVIIIIRHLRNVVYIKKLYNNKIEINVDWNKCCIIIRHHYKHFFKVMLYISKSTKHF
jgi:hypothetical protein